MLNSLKQSQIKWYSFSEDTLQQAKNENKAIYLFIESYASYWSDIMNIESSQNEAVVELLNERFICIKVDKHERPDIEKYYQKVYSLMNRQTGGLPLNIFLTQDLEPFYASSYIAVTAVKEQLGFEELLRVISKKYITDYETLSKKGHEVLQYIDPKEQSIQATKLNLSVMQTISVQVTEMLDKEYGGFTTAPKFPNVTTLELLLDVYELQHNKTLLNAVTLTLDNMAKGGFYDHKQGGFYVYAKDTQWKTAHRVKTTYDNAALMSLYTRAYELTNNSEYKSIALQTMDYMIKNQTNDKLFLLANENIICSWNAMMVSTLFKASSLDKKYALKAIETLDAILSKLYVNGTLYHTLSSKAFLEDYTQLGESLITAYQYTLDESFLVLATQFSNLIIEQFYDQAQWKYSNSDFKIKENIHDGIIPSSISSALSLLLSISSLVDTNYKKFVFKSLELNSFNLMRQPLSSPKLTQVVLRYLKDDIIIKSNESLLKENIDKRNLIGYPYVLFKKTLDDELKIYNSHSYLASEKKFENIKLYLERIE